ncbi:GIY-YIG nuclease family protein [Frigoriglobus tundricola]|uniref:GIY-YIG nuclease family protein n=1 Tax=Frigoriglobus tundricola TaxID=2774151 RepID=UPI001D083479|nr:GIY-YIG nuclease family protein [Frigoriglobus tundricola]
MLRTKAEWWVYLLKCRDGTLYTGITTDVERRLAQHNAGTASKYTRSRRPVAVVYRESAQGHGAALRREIAIKKLSRAAKDALVASQRRRRRPTPQPPSVLSPTLSAELLAGRGKGGG